MKNEFLIPPGFKDEVKFDAYVEHEFKNKIIDYFMSNGFDLVKTPLIEFKDNINANNLVIESKKTDDQLRVRNDITPQIVRLVNSRLAKRKRPIKLCYYGEVVRKYGTMLRPERQFLQVGAETIGEQKVEADIEIIKNAYSALNIIGIKKITLELSSRIFLDKFFSKLASNIERNKLEDFIKKKDLDNCLNIIEYKDQELIKNIFLCTGSFEKVNSNLDLLNIDSETLQEINKIREIAKAIELNNNE